MSVEQGRVYTTTVLPALPQDRSEPADLQERFERFLLEYFTHDVFLYRERLMRNVVTDDFTLTVAVEHVILFDPYLADDLKRRPAETVPLFEKAATKVAQQVARDKSNELGDLFPIIQIILTMKTNPISIRRLGAKHISRLVKMPAIVVNASSLSSKAVTVQLMCRNCRHTMRMDVPGGLSALQLPKKCQAAPVSGKNVNDDCPPNPYVIVHDKSVFIDQQVLKLQESPEMIPVGELPRNILATVDRSLTNLAVPGSRCMCVGIYSIYQSKGRTPGAVAIRSPYMRIIGFEITSGQQARENVWFDAEEIQEFRRMSQMPNFFERFAKSIAPTIIGHEEVKKAVACLLMGGSRRILPDNMRLRGDINVLLLGDPGTAKSQILKWVEKAAPISVYTSGKGSSAAGLTASVQRDVGSQDFYLEGGAMVLADGGVVCIDEFDKMREDDRVAIHEAMEQQTISIAKAGITTVLNSRTSVLAAANPLFGSYDNSKTPGENIDFQTTILSRFDMIFIIKDEHNAEWDDRVARHVMDTHIQGSRQSIWATEAEGEIPMAKMRRYIQYCRARYAPRLDYNSAQRLAAFFIDIRDRVHEREVNTNERSTVPITVRQLEAIIRIAESIAKLHLSTQVTQQHVDEAIRLFQASTMTAINQESNSREVSQEVTKVEEELRSRLPVGWRVSYKALVNQFVDVKNYNKFSLDVALRAMERRGSIEFRHQGQSIFRISNE